MQTATNPQTGEKVQWNGSAWVPLGQAAPSAPAAGQPYTVGTPRQKGPEVRQVGSQLGVVGNDGSFTPTFTAPENVSPTAQANTRFDNSANLRKEYNALPEVKDYGAAMSALGTMWKAPDNAQGDLAVVYGFAKAMDPGSVVREGEMDMANATSSVVQDIYRKYGQISEGNRLPPEVRKQLIAAAAAKGRTLNEAYSQQRARYKGLSEQGGFTADEIIGNHLGDAFQGSEAEFRQAAGFEAKPRPPLYDELEKEYTAAGISFELDEDGKPIPVLTASSVGKPAIDPLLAGVGDLVEGVGDVAGLVVNPLTVAANTAFGTNIRPDYGQNLRDQLGLPEGNQLASAINQGGISAITGTGIASGASRVLGGVGQAVAKQAAQQPVQQAVAGMSSGAASQAAQDANLGPGGQMIAGVAGGLAGYGGASAMATRLNPQPNALMQAANRQNVRLMPADVAGPETKNLAAAAAKAPLSAGPIIKGAKQTQGDLQSALSRTANAEGTPLPIDEAGEQLRAPLKDYAVKQGQRIGKVYDRAEERAKGVKIKPNQAVAFLDDQIARFKDAPKGESIVKDLTDLRSQIAGGVSVSGMRDARTILSQGVYDGKLRSPMQKGIYKQFLKSLSGDIEAGLSAAGRGDALNLFRTADKAWSERIDYIDGVLEPIVGGNKSGEDILKSVEAMAKGQKGGVSRLVEVMREMPPEQAQNVRATIIERMGEAIPSQQDADGSGFSSQTFLTNWNKMSGKGKAALFSDSELRRNLNDIAELSGAVRESAKYANVSNTPGGIWGNIGALGGVATISPKFAMVAGVLQVATGRLLSSRTFTRWLARMPSNEAAKTRHVEQLGQIAAREPIIANDIASVQQFLAGGSQRAAASPEDEQ